MKQQWQLDAEADAATLCKFADEPEHRGSLLWLYLSAARLPEVLGPDLAATAAFWAVPALKAAE